MKFDRKNLTNFESDEIMIIMLVFFVVVLVIYHFVGWI